jgi:hypothetical protein
MASSWDSIGPFATNVEDAALVLQGWLVMMIEMLHRLWRFLIILNHYLGC